MARRNLRLVDPVFRAASGVPRGDGRPVVLLPGFLAGDQTLALMAAWLRRLGYAP
jgi:triacylglycerol lipase